MKGGMTVEKKDMSALLGGLANKSEKEQAAKKAAARSGTAYVAKAEDDEKTSRVGRPAKYTKNNPRATMTLAITANHRDKIKLYAMQNHTTVSELFMQWIDENCK